MSLFAATRRWARRGSVLAAPGAWLRRAVTQSGMERAALIQAIKASVAAVIAWVIAADVLHFSQPFLAPWSAIFIVAATVYRSIHSAAQQLAAAFIAVILASVATGLIQWDLLALFVAVLVGLLIGQWRFFGDSGTWIGITALLIMTSGSMEESALVDRLIETAIGAAIGIAVNAAIAPPVYQLKASDAIARVAEDLADVLEHMGEAAISDDRQRFDSGMRARAAVVLMRDAEQAVALDRESRRLNPRLRTGGVGSDHENTLSALRHAWSHVEELGKTLQTTRQESGPFEERTRQCLADMFAQLADLVRRCSDDTATETDVEQSAADAGRRLDSVEQILESTDSVTISSVARLVTITAPARHIIRELSSR
ncbi:FUSC family protein [Gordonia rubripertincta]|uniref:Aromatic acid exporter family protein n=1 Tax=Gordonia rubripertincta TaxID=36822 RepID=A0ABT4MQB2_GORRU|nr:aromatic acid exporter family protein [Gordonia rubripertincta]MCZ4549192.1 aromatic acid exporter family protein [Gordonia rubripertincta]